MWWHKGGPSHQQMGQGFKYLLGRNNRAKNIGNRIQVAMKQPKNLKSFVGGSKKSKTEHAAGSVETGCFKCKGCRVACPVLVESKTFKSFNKGKIYQRRQRVDCKSSWVVYLFLCKKCGGQYVGKSQTAFKKCNSNHKQEIKKEIGGLGHFSLSSLCSAGRCNW